MLAFQRAERSPALRGGPARPDDRKRYADLRRLLMKRFESGRNLVIVGHGNPFYGVAGPPYLAEGEAALVRPLGNNFEIAARIKVTDWAALRKVMKD